MKKRKKEKRKKRHNFRQLWPTSLSLSNFYTRPQHFKPFHTISKERKRERERERKKKKKKKRKEKRKRKRKTFVLPHCR